MTEDLASMLAHNSLADAQSETCAFPDILGGKKGVEDAVWTLDPVAVVAKDHLDQVVQIGRADFDARGAARIAHGIVGIVQNVQKNLLQLVRVPDHQVEILVQVFEYLDTAAMEIIGAQLHGAVQDGVELDRLALRRHGTGEGEQVLHDLFGALRLLQDDAQVLAGALRYIGILEKQIGKAENRGKRVVDLMGDTGNQLAHGHHFLRMDQLCL